MKRHSGADDGDSEITERSKGFPEFEVLFRVQRGEDRHLNNRERGVREKDFAGDKGSVIVAAFRVEDGFEAGRSEELGGLLGDGGRAACVPGVFVRLGREA